MKSGAIGIDGARAVDVRLDGGRVAAVCSRPAARTVRDRLRPAGRRRRRALPARQGARPEWHRDTVYGVAGRSYVDSTVYDDPWISSHLELRGEDGEILSGYGWIFPLGDGSVNLGVGTLATAKRPAEVALRPLMQHYADQRRDDFGLSGDLRMPTSAMLPMGGAVSQRRRPELGADRRRGRVRQPVERRGHRLRARDRPAARRPAGRVAGEDLSAGLADRCASTTARRSRSRAGSPGWSRSRDCCRHWARRGCGRTG